MTEIKMPKILLVEDDPGLGEVLTDQLELKGYGVSLLRNPAKTVDNLLKEKFDLVIMDKLLCGIDGTQICKKIRYTEGISGIPILMMSGYDGAREHCIASGANYFIAKPFDLKGFLKSIDATMEEARDLQD